MINDVAGKRNFFSELPDYFIEGILLRLPIEDAVRTSVLSSQWRYKWTTMPTLIFDEYCLKSTSPRLLTTMFLNIIYKILFQHRGPIKKFLLSALFIKSEYYVYEWFNLLFEHGVEDFTLKIHDGEHYDLRPSIFSCQQLKNLKIRLCIVRPPDSFCGFQNLRSLSIEECRIHENAFKSLITSCPHLERLEIINLKIMEVIIDVPTLKYFHVQGLFRNVNFPNAKSLTSLLIHSSLSPVIDKEDPVRQEPCRMKKILSCLPKIEKFQVMSNSMKFLSVGIIPKKLPMMLNHLRDISLAMNFQDPYEIEVALCLLRSSPNLEQLHFGVWVEKQKGITTKDVKKFWDKQDKLYCCFSKLRRIKMDQIFGVENEITIIKYILKYSPILEKMELVIRGRKWMKEHAKFEELMLQVELKFKCPEQQNGLIIKEVSKGDLISLCSA
ncbi:hypothetical protein AQUCO_01000390v1 [Aquilegia coerulea]|uniref:F-box domain-containing protein n=1 Tax=Aquilegia coerulea TaxID=218851 RepID=A0A2G5E9Q1_AQUCA|nr:hypothetical protein AQUCO_01000390v1 [Aquilegia coerulea]